jgi:hypothetical protein
MPRIRPAQPTQFVSIRQRAPSTRANQEPATIRLGQSLRPQTPYANAQQGKTKGGGGNEDQKIEQRDPAPG